MAESLTGIEFTCQIALSLIDCHPVHTLQRALNFAHKAVATMTDSPTWSGINVEGVVGLQRSEC